MTPKASLQSESAETKANGQATRRRANVQFDFPLESKALKGKYVVFVRVGKLRRIGLTDEWYSDLGSSLDRYER